MKVDMTGLHRKITPYLVEDRVDMINKFYCPPMQAFDWQKGRPIDKGQHNFEQRLKDFFIKNSDSPHADSLLVLVGGIGTGKTTTVNKIFQEIDVVYYKSGTPSNTSENKPIFLKLDLQKVSEIEQKSQIDAEQQFWAYISAELEVSYPISLDPTEEVTKFWIWCSRQSPLLANSILVHKHLQVYKPQIESVITNTGLLGIPANEILRILIESRNILLDKMNASDLCWYKAHLIKYDLMKQRSSLCKCVYVCFDNVDHLHPAVQRTAVSFAVNFTELLDARSIITIRPLTWERSVHAQVLTSVEYQYSPSLFDVISKRMDWFLSEQTIAPEEKCALLSLTKIMTGKGRDTLLSKVLLSTVGYGIRFALRNFSNMLESPLLSNVSVENDDPITLLRVSELARAYFFGKRNNMIPHAFENLYAVSGSVNEDSCLIKPRILDYIARFSDRNVSLQKLLEFLENFSYNKDMIISALNELLDQQRPLLWCNIGFVLDSHVLDAKLVITPMGRSYYSELFGEVLYDEICLASDLTKIVDLREIYAHHQSITDQDLKEIKSFCIKNTSMIYKKFYPSRIISISYLHGKQLMNGLPKRATQEREKDFFDPARLNWIAKKVETVLNEPD